MADVWPLPNRPGLVDNYLENNVQTNDLNAFDVRGDVNLGAWGSLFARYSRAERDFVEPPAGGQFMEGGNSSESANFNAVVGYTYTISPEKLNEFRLGNPNTTFGAGPFGRISGTRLPSWEVQLGARLLF